MGHLLHVLDGLESEHRGYKMKNAEFTPGDFKRMFEMMSKCCAGQGGSTDCSAMMDGMMKGMMEMCCRPKADSTKEDRGHGKV